MNPQDLQNLLDTLNKFSAQLGTIADDIRNNVQQTTTQATNNNTRTFRSYNYLNAATEKLSKRLEQNEQLQGRYSDTTKQNEAAVKSFTKNVRQSTGDFAQQMRDGRLSLNEFRVQIDEIKDSITAEQNLKVQQKQEIMRELERMEKYSVAQAKYGVAIETTGKILGQFGVAAGAVGSALVKMAGAYQNSGGQIGLASTVLTSSVGMAGQGLSAAGNAASIAGSAITSMNPYARAASVALKVLGVAAGVAGAVLSKTAQTVLPILNTELEKQINNFQTISSVGALFANGVTGMRKAAVQAGMDLDLLAKVFKNNQEELSNSGLGMARTMERFAGARARSIADGFQKQLLNLGYSLEEQGALTAQVFEQLGRSGKARTTSDADIAKQTMEYGKTLRVLTELTGADAAKRMQDAARQLQEVQMDAKIREMEAKDPGARARIQAILATVPKELQLAVKQKLVLGQVVDENSNILMSQVPKLGEAINRSAELANDSTLDGVKAAGETTKAFAAAKESIGKDLSVIGQAALADPSGAFAGVADKANKVISDLTKMPGAEEVDKSLKGVEAAAKTFDKATIAMNQVIEKEIQLRQQIQAEILDSNVLGKYAKAMGELTDEVIKQLAKFGKEKLESEKTTGEKVGGAIGEGLLPVGLGIAGGAIGSLTGPMGTVAGAAIGTALGEAINSMGIGEMMKSAGEVMGGVIESAGAVAMKSVGSLLDLVKAAPKAKEGGIIDSDAAGSLAVLHGREAVIPLDSGSKYLDDAIDNRLQQLQPARNPAMVEAGTDTTQLQRQMLDLVKQTMPVSGFKIGDVIKTLQEDNAVTLNRITNKSSDSIQALADTAAREIALYGQPINDTALMIQQLAKVEDGTAVNQLQKQMLDLVKQTMPAGGFKIGDKINISETGAVDNQNTRVLADSMDRNAESNIKSMENVVKPLEDFNKGVSGFASMFNLNNITEAFSGVREMMAKPFTEAYASMRSPESINTASNRMIEQNATDMAASRDMIAKLNDSITEMKNNQNRTVNAVTGSTDESGRDKLMVQQTELLSMINDSMRELNRISRDISAHTERSSNAAY